MWNAAVTNAGAAILAQWIAGGTLTIDGAAAGTGRVDVSALAASTAMAGTRHTLAIASYAVSAANRTTTFRVAISAEASAYTLTQIGIWGHVDEGSSTLLAIYQTDEGIAVPASSAMPEYSYIFGATVAVNGSGELSVTVDSSIAVTHAELDAELATLREFMLAQTSQVSSVSVGDSTYISSVSGGYIKLGRLVVFSIGFKAKTNIAQSVPNAITGLPNAVNYGRFFVYDNYTIADFSSPRFANISGTALTIKGAYTANETYYISGAYISAS